MRRVLGRAFQGLVITSSTCASVTVRGRPGRGSSSNPAKRSSLNRTRHVETVLRCTLSCLAICVLLCPAAASSTIRDLVANA